LSIKQKELHVRIHSETNPTIRQELKKQRSKIQHDIRKILKHEGNKYWQEKADDADALHPDPRSYFNAIRQLRQQKSSSKQPPIHLQDNEGQIVSDVDWNLSQFRDYYSSVFHRDDLPDSLNIPEVLTESAPICYELQRLSLPPG